MDNRIKKKEPFYEPYLQHKISLFIEYAWKSDKKRLMHRKSGQSSGEGAQNRLEEQQNEPVPQQVLLWIPSMQRKPDPHRSASAQVILPFGARNSWPWLDGRSTICCQDSRGTSCRWDRQQEWEQDCLHDLCLVGSLCLNCCTRILPYMRKWRR